MHTTHYNPTERKCGFAALQWFHTLLTQHWFNRASHLHLLSHSSSTTPLIVMCWQCCLSKVIVTFSHVWSACCGFSLPSHNGGLKLLCAEDDTAGVTNDEREGERQWKFLKNQYILNTRLTLTLLSKLFPRQPSWSMKVSDNDNCDTAMTGPLAGTGSRPIWWCIWTDICTFSIFSSHSITFSNGIMSY